MKWSLNWICYFHRYGSRTEVIFTKGRQLTWADVPHYQTRIVSTLHLLFHKPSHRQCRVPGAVLACNLEQNPPPNCGEGVLSRTPLCLGTGLDPPHTTTGGTFNILQ